MSRNYAELMTAEEVIDVLCEKVERSGGYPGAFLSREALLLIGKCFPQGVRIIGD